MPQYLATVRIVTRDRTVEPGLPIGPEELAPEVWAGLVRKGRIVEAAEKLLAGVAPPGWAPQEGEVPADIEERLASLPSEARAMAGSLPKDPDPT